VVLSGFRSRQVREAVGKGRRCMELGQDVDASSTRFQDGMQVLTRRGSVRGTGGFDLSQHLSLQLVHLTLGKERQPEQAVAAVYGGTEVEPESVPALVSRHLLISVLCARRLTAASPAPPICQSARRLVPPFRIIELFHCPKQSLHVNTSLRAELPCPRKSLMRDHNHGDHESQDGRNKRRRIDSDKACTKERPDCANTSRVGDGAKERGSPNTTGEPHKGVVLRLSPPHDQWKHEVDQAQRCCGSAVVARMGRSDDSLESNMGRSHQE